MGSPTEAKRPPNAPAVGAATPEQLRVFKQAKQAKRPVLQPGEVAVRVAPALIRRRGVEREVAPYLKAKTAAWPSHAVEFVGVGEKMSRTGTYRWHGSFWLVLRGGKDD